MRKLRCPYCGSLYVIKWGYQSCHQRYKCKSCGKYFTHRRSEISAQNRFVWFRQWVEYGHTIEYISRRSGYGERTLKRYFYEHLKNHPTWHIRPAEKVNLMIDGAYFANKLKYEQNKGFRQLLDKTKGKILVEDTTVQNSSNSVLRWGCQDLQKKELIKQRRKKIYYIMRGQFQSTR